MMTFNQPNPVIDCHILHLKNENVEWRKACDESLAKNESPFIRFHHLPGIAGDYKAARRNGLLHGELPIVSFVDPDDLVGAGAFAAAFFEMRESDAAVWTASMTVRGRVMERAKHARPHQLILARRVVVEAVLRGGPLDDRALWERVAQFGEVRHLPNVLGYVWRDHPRGHHWRGDESFARENG